MKNKKWLVFAIVSALCATIGATACTSGKDNGSNNENSSSVENSSIGETNSSFVGGEEVSISFLQSVMALYQYDEAQLLYSVEGSE